MKGFGNVPVFNPFIELLFGKIVVVKQGLVVLNPKVWNFFVEKGKFEAVFKDTDGSLWSFDLLIEFDGAFRVDATWHASEMRKLRNIYNDLLHYSRREKKCGTISLNT